MTATHTTKPWIAVRSSDKLGVLIQGALEEWPHEQHAVPGLRTPRRRLIATTHGRDAEGLANAALMKSAPELLDACEQLLAYVEAERGWKGEADAEPMVMTGRAAIKRATTPDV